jgi:hypothetical protein
LQNRAPRSVGDGLVTAATAATTATTTATTANVLWGGPDADPSRSLQRSLADDVGECGEQCRHVAETCGVAHRADSPDRAGHRSETATDFDAVVA